MDAAQVKEIVIVHQTNHGTTLALQQLRFFHEILDQGVNLIRMESYPTLEHGVRLGSVARHEVVLK